MLFSRSVFVGLSLLASATAIKELVALIPTEGIDEPIRGTVLWTQLVYAVNASRVSEVDVVKHDDLDEEMVELLGNWYRGDFYGAELTGKIVGDKFYWPMKTRDRVNDDNWTPGGCCGNQFRSMDRNTGETKDFNLEEILRPLFPNVSYGETHTFDMNGDVAVLQVQYVNDGLNANVNTIVLLDTATGDLLATADGQSFFDTYEHLGTLSLNPLDQIHSIFYYKKPKVYYNTEEWHMNGIQRFTAKDDIVYIAYTHYWSHEVVVIKDPFTYTAADGGGSIVQRFGTPNNGPIQVTSQQHHFGVDTDVSFPYAVHNVFYSASSSTTELLGQETLTIFVNILKGSDYSQAAEFAFRPTTSDSKLDSVFDTSYVLTPFTFQQSTCGGTRPLANGIYIATSGCTGAHPVGFGGFEIVDRYGMNHTINYATESIDHVTYQYFDPYIRVVVEE